MILSIYKIMLSNNFTSKGQDLKNNKRLGIEKTFSDQHGRYVEIYKEEWGHSIFIYGKGFMNGYYPFGFDITCEADIESLNKKIKNTI